MRREGARDSVATVPGDDSTIHTCFIRRCMYFACQPILAQADSSSVMRREKYIVTVVPRGVFQLTSVYIEYSSYRQQSSVQLPTL